MNNDELDLLVRGLTYKPGWSFQFLRPVEPWAQEPMHTVVVRARLADSNGTRNPSEVAARAFIPFDADLHMALHAIHSCIQNLEGHEMLEWFKLNGVQAFDPHPGGRDSFATRPQRPGEVVV